MSNALSVNALEEENNNNYRTDIYTAIESRLDYMTERFSRVCVVLLVIRFPVGYYHPEPTSLFSDFIGVLSRNLKRNCIIFQRVSVCEKNTSSMPHYHLMMIIDGNKIKSPYGIGYLADELWGKRFGYTGLGGLVDYTNQYIGKDHLDNALMLNRNEPEFSYLKGQILDAAMYFSKRYSKGSLPKNMREVMCSQLPR